MYKVRKKWSQIGLHPLISGRPSHQALNVAEPQCPSALSSDSSGDDHDPRPQHRYGLPERTGGGHLEKRQSPHTHTHTLLVGGGWNRPSG